MLNSAELIAAAATHLMSRSIHLSPISTGTSTLRDDVSATFNSTTDNKTVFGDRAIHRFDLGTQKYNNAIG